MIYDTKGEFIQALKDYDTYKEKSEVWQNKYRDLYYLRYEKVRSPLDYDIVGYENGEAIRQLKGRGSFNSEVISDSQQRLDSELERCIEENSKLLSKIHSVESEIAVIKEPLKTIIMYRYMGHHKLKDVCKKFKDLYLDEAGMHKYIMRELDRYYEL